MILDIFDDPADEGDEDLSPIISGSITSVVSHNEMPLDEIKRLETKSLYALRELVAPIDPTVTFVTPTKDLYNWRNEYGWIELPSACFINRRHALYYKIEIGKKDGIFRHNLILSSLQDYAFAEGCMSKPDPGEASQNLFATKIEKMNEFLVMQQDIQIGVLKQYSLPLELNTPNNERWGITLDLTSPNSSETMNVFKEAMKTMAVAMECIEPEYDALIYKHSLTNIWTIDQ